MFRSVWSHLLSAPRRPRRRRSAPILRTSPPRLEQLEDRTVPAVLNLAQPGNPTSGFLNGGFFELINQQPAGSGVLHSFVRLHDLGRDDSNTPQGHNTSGRNPGSPKLNFDENSSPVFTRDLQLKDVPLVNAKDELGRTKKYREFRLDVNEPNHNPAVPLSLNKVKIFTNTTGGPNANGGSILASGIDISELGALRWDMDGNITASGTDTSGPYSGPDSDSAAPSADGNWVCLNDRNHGSGQADLRLLVPESAFNAVSGDAYVYLFSRFGDTKEMTGGFEEWYVGPAAKEKPVNVTTRIDRILPGGGEVQGPTDGSVFNVPFGSTVHDHAFVTDVATGNPVLSGSVTFQFFSGLDCQEPIGDPYTDVNGLDGWQTPDNGPLLPGDYSYIATYNGDPGKYNGGTAECEPLHVERGQPGVNYDVATVLHRGDPEQDQHDVVPDGSAVALGTIMHDTATVTPTLPTYPTPTGFVRYEFFAGGECSEDEDGDPLTPDADALWFQTVEIANGVVPESQATAALAAGSYSFHAVYLGDGNYDPGTSPCEPFTVNKADVQVRTEVHNNDHVDITGTIVLNGTPVHDFAIVTGQVGPFVIGGTVTYELWSDTDGDGDGDVLPSGYTWTVAVGVDGSPVVTPAGGFWAYRARYNGDDPNYNPSADGAWEPFTVLTSQPGHTPGFWQNPNGQALITEDDLAELRALNLVDADGNPFDPTTKEDVADWILANATNMAYKLSSFLATITLNINHGFNDGSGLVYAPSLIGTYAAAAAYAEGPGGQFIRLDNLLLLANTELGVHPTAYSGDPWRPYQDALHRLLDQIANGVPLFLP